MSGQKNIRVLALMPPMVQVNTPYPSTACLTGFLRSRGVEAFQTDLALELVLLQRDARSAAALGYLLLTLVGGLGLVWLGAMLATLCSPASGAAP